MSKVIRLNKATEDLLEVIKEKYIHELEREWLYILNNTNDEDHDEWKDESLRKLSFEIEDHKRYTDSDWIYTALVALENMIE